MGDSLAAAGFVIYFTISIEYTVMSTVQVEDRVKKKLFSIAAKLQAESGRKLSLSEAIDGILEMHSHQENMIDKRKVLSLFGILQYRERSARVALWQLVVRFVSYIRNNFSFDLAIIWASSFCSLSRSLSNCLLIFSA